MVHGELVLSLSLEEGREIKSYSASCFVVFCFTARVRRGGGYIQGSWGVALMGRKGGLLFGLIVKPPRLHPWLVSRPGPYSEIRLYNTVLFMNLRYYTNNQSYIYTTVGTCTARWR